MSIVSLRHIVKYYGKILTIDNLSLEIENGCFFTLLGPSGCGKTTLLRSFAGFIVPDGGQVLFDSTDVTRQPPHLRNIGMVFQDYALFPDKTVFANVAYGLRARRVSEEEIKKRVGEILERVNLCNLADRIPARLSGGQMQRVALARALVIRPQVLLMDEPLSNLDTKLRVEMRSVIRDLQREFGITTIFVTHDQEEALALSDWVALLNRGQVEQMDRPKTLFHLPKTRFSAEFLGAANLIPVETVALRGETMTCRLSDFTIQAIANGLDAKQPALLCVHSNEIALLSLDAPKAGAVTAEVESCDFAGSRRMYGILLNHQRGPQVLRVEQSTGFGAPQFEVGSKVQIVFSESRCLIPEASI